MNGKTFWRDNSQMTLKLGGFLRRQSSLRRIIRRRRKNREAWTIWWMRTRTSYVFGLHIEDRLLRGQVSAVSAVLVSSVSQWIWISRYDNTCQESGKNRLGPFTGIFKTFLFFLSLPCKVFSFLGSHLRIGWRFWNLWPISNPSHWPFFHALQFVGWCTIKRLLYYKQNRSPLMDQVTALGLSNGYSVRLYWIAILSSYFVIVPNTLSSIYTFVADWSRGFRTRTSSFNT